MLVMNGPAGQRATVIKTLQDTAKLNDLEPATWLRIHPGKASRPAQSPHRQTATSSLSTLLLAAKA